MAYQAGQQVSADGPPTGSIAGLDVGGELWTWLGDTLSTRIGLTAEQIEFVACELITERQPPDASLSASDVRRLHEKMKGLHRDYASNLLDAMHKRFPEVAADLPRP